MAGARLAADDLNSARETQSRLRREIADLESSVDADRRRLRDHQTQLMGGGLTSARDLSRLETEVGHLRQAVGEVEDRELELMGQLEEAERHAVVLEGAVGEAERLAEAEEAARAGAAGQQEGELAALEASRSELAAQVEASILSLYERVAARHQGSGCAYAGQGQCGGCHVALTPAQLQRIRTSQTPVTCAACERILVIG